MAIGVTGQRSWYSPPKLLHAVGEVRRYPVFPIAILLIVLVIPAIFAEVVSPYDPLKGQLGDRLTPPFWQEGGSAAHLLGADKLGHDMLSRVIYGSRISVKSLQYPSSSAASWVPFWGSPPVTSGAG